ncbi:hypothetical protein FAUST_4178 [Fusarium austroamericanum]|uniref:Heterokaryon incompatibility domain-containing protein n=1 Tax=Fusarium austroamericanum TaxID=282268 RepID=A0AAN6HGY8_FUSAU|nr:hypothetical protein FAUST_4178 [Fusarium austroamericanum]
MSIEQPKSNKGFVALSYMWPSETDSERAQLQKHNVELWEKPDDLRNIPMPPLISDDMSLCQRLGETYIWIDRFCIVQDDAASKHDQVSGMHQIFRSASFTLVVALDDRNPPGLPGFIHRPRGSTINKPRVKYDVETLVVKRGLELVNDSTWNTRGWTFQERLLSPRRIYITEHEVQYECYLGYASEIFTHIIPYKTSTRSLSYLLKKRPVSQLPGFYASDEYSGATEFHITERTSIHDYMRLVRDYTRRNLSYSSDILNAFAGVEGRLKNLWGSPFHFGLPEKYLHIALMWRPNYKSTLRMSGMSIPSWSWASVTNGTNYDWLSGSNMAPRVVSLVSFYYQTHENGLRKLDVQEWWVKYDQPNTQHQRELPLVKSKTNRLWKECPENPWQTFEQQHLSPDACQIAANLPGCLVFNTAVTRLDVGQWLLGDFYDLPDEFSEILRNSDDRILDMMVISDTFSSCYESKGLWRGPDERITASDDFRRWQLRVMLIERYVSQPYVARRLAVGHVGTRCWEGYTTRWETIVLC